MMLRKILVALFLLLALYSSPVFAAKYSSLEILPYADGSGIPKIAMKVNLYRGAKSYWRMPGESGASSNFNWQESENIKEFNINYPAPRRFEFMGIESFGYDSSFILPVDMKLENVNKDTVLNLKAEILVCKELCIPEYHNIELFLGDHFNHYLSIKDDLVRVPVKLHESKLKASWISKENKEIFVNLKLAPISGIDSSFDLFLENEAATILDKPELRIAKNGEIFVKSKIRYLYDLEGAKEELENKRAIFTFSNGAKGYELSTIFVNNKDGVKADGYSYKLKIILFALLGGLILNLMPCVLPVLSIKVLSILKYGGGAGSRLDIFRSFMVTSMGIISSFWLLALGLSLLRYGGESIGWGIQFQYPPFLMFLILVLIFFAANLWGMFDILLPQSVSGKVDNMLKGNNLTADFLTGMFATLLATPCSAPFLGTAITYALSTSYINIFMIFTCLGIGLAMPYIVLAFSPKLFKYLPKPGAWMVTLKKLLAILVMLTALWLGSILYSIYSQKVINSEWQKFDYSIIEPAINEDKIVFVDITAKWCLTCKANKKFVLETEDIKELLDAENILKLQGDWTAKDEYISEYLRENGRYGVPFNIIYSKKYPQGYVLPELLSKEIIFRALGEVR